MNDPQNYTDYISSLKEEELLLQQMAADNMEAFNILYKYFQPRLYLYILPSTQNTGIAADEIVQDIFVKIWIKRKAFTGISSLEHYLYRMARNRLVDLRRSRVTHTQHIQNFQAYNPAQANTTADEVQFREFKSIAVKAIKSLPERRRKIFELSVEKDLSLTEIAAVMELSKAVVKKQLYLATSYIRDFIQKETLLLLPFIFYIYYLLNTK